MSTLLQSNDGGPGLQVDVAGTSDEEYWLIGDILTFHRGHLPTLHVRESDTAQEEMADPVLIVRQRNIKPYRFEGRLAWASYQEIVAKFREQRRRSVSSHNW